MALKLCTLLTEKVTIGYILHKVVKVDYGLRNRETRGLFSLNITSRFTGVNPH